MRPRLFSLGNAVACAVSPKMVLTGFNEAQAF